MLDAIGLNLAATPETDDRQERGGPEDSGTRNRRAVLEQLSAGKISPEEAMRALSGGAKPPIRNKAKSEREEPDHG